MSATTPATQKPQAAQPVTLNPLVQVESYLQGLTECGPVLPEGIKCIIAAYGLELNTQPRELFARVEFYFHTSPQDGKRPDAVTYCVAYDRVERLFRGLRDLGNKLQCRELVNEHIRHLAVRPYTFSEEARSEEVNYICDLWSRGKPFWCFALVNNAQRDMEQLINPNRSQLPIQTRCDTGFEAEQNLTLDRAQECVLQARDIVNLNRLLNELGLGIKGKHAKEASVVIVSQENLPSLTHSDVETVDALDRSVRKDVQLIHAQKMQSAKNNCNKISAGFCAAVIFVSLFASIYFGTQR